MPDYIYLLENRLSADQQSAVRHLRDAAREAEMILFLTGDAVRDLTSGHAVRDIEVAVYGDAFKLKKIVEKVGGKIWGEDEESRSLYLCFPGTVRVDLVSTHRVEYPKPGQPVYHLASIHEDLRRRDFTVNAMAISLNEGSFGLLMDPLNGAADIEARTLRLVSNYGFIEEPSLLVRATRYRTRLGWELDPKSQTRYENAKSDGVIEYLSRKACSLELEQIGHEEDGLKVLHALDAEGWMKVLFPPWTPAKADEEKLKALHELAVELLMQRVHADISAAQMQLLTAKMAPKDTAALKKLLLRPGFVEEWNSLDNLAAGFAKVLLAKDNQTPSSSFKLFTSYDPEAVLWLGFTSKDSAVKERYNLFLKIWPEARQRIPYVLMQEMRIKPELPTYNDIVQSIFLELIDERLGTVEEMRAFLEPHSPPAPPPQITIKRTRAKRGAEKIKDSYDDEEEPGADSDEDLDDMGGDDDDVGIGLGIPKVDLEPDAADDIDSDDSDEEEADDETATEPAPAKRGSKASAPAKRAKQAPVAPLAPAKAGKQAAAQKLEAAPKSHPAPKPEPEAKRPAKATAKPAAAAKSPIPPAKSTLPGAKLATPHATAKTAASPAKGSAPAVKKVFLSPHAAVKKAVSKPAAKKVPLKPPVKSAIKSAAKIPAKGHSAKPTAAKAQPSRAAISKSGKPSKPLHPAKPAPKKPAGKAAKKR